jgi:hypothetical protein
MTDIGMIDQGVEILFYGLERALLFLGGEVPPVPNPPFCGAGTA